MTHEADIPVRPVGSDGPVGPADPIESAAVPADPSCRTGRARGGTWRRGLAYDLLFCAAAALVLTGVFRPLFGIEVSQLPLLFYVNYVITLAIGMSCSNAYRWVFSFLARRWSGRWSVLAIHVLMIVPSVVIGTEIALLVLRLTGFPEMVSQRSDIIQIGLVVCTVIVLLALAYEGLQAQARASELRAERAHQQALRAQLDALQARTNPHFLFNSLNTVAGLIQDEPEAAERMLERLSSLFRYALAGSRATWVKLEEELRAVRDYLEVETIRFGDRLRVEIDADDTVSSVLVPPLVLQPLVENAVLHGIVPRKSGGSLRVAIRSTRDTLRLTVADDGPGSRGSPHRGTGRSLAELRERLRLVYGDGASLTTSDAPQGGFRVALTLPVRREETSS
ncbi:MAG: histidine kinase [Acidobacteriota bacterium]|nr:MAG: histidine kinase [Acidobacteriota bacterium]